MFGIVRTEWGTYSAQRAVDVDDFFIRDFLETYSNYKAVDGAPWQKIFTVDVAEDLYTNGEDSKYCITVYCTDFDEKRTFSLWEIFNDFVCDSIDGEPADWVDPSPQEYEFEKK